MANPGPTTKKDDEAGPANKTNDKARAHKQKGRHQSNPTNKARVHKQNLKPNSNKQNKEVIKYE